MIKINTLNELSSEHIEVVIFTMPTCGPCKIMKPSLQMAVEGMDDVTLYELDAEANIEVARELNVASTPTTIFFKNGEEKQRTVGFRPLPQIQQTLKSL